MFCKYEIKERFARIRKYMPKNILQKIFREENEDLTTIGTLLAQNDTEHLFTNAGINNWIYNK